MPPPPGPTPGRRWPRPARAGSMSARVARCCGTTRSSRRPGSRTAAARRASPVVEFSSWDLHTALLRLIDELGGILPQAVRECANVLGRLPALTRKALELRQPVARERTHVLAVVGDHLVELLARARQMVRNAVHAPRGGLHVRAGRIDQRMGAACGCG